MHMADALVSPVVGGAMWAVAGGLTVYSARRLTQGLDERRVPLMGVVGAFVFSAQMINFSIPGTGSSGHLGGGMILAILLGPHAAFITMASVLTLQALLFADGGLLALGCNIFNLGFFPCFVAYPLIYRAIVPERPTSGRLLAGATLAGVMALQLGALGVVIETVFSGVSELPFVTFSLLMFPIHLAIGVVEGLVTACVVGLVWKARPEILESAVSPQVSFSAKRVLVAIGLATFFIAGFLSWFASSHPDGLEWSIAKTSGKEELNRPESSVFSTMKGIQEKTSVLPDYNLPMPEGESSEGNAGTSIAGLVGAGLTLAVVGILGVILRKKNAAA